MGKGKGGIGGIGCELIPGPNDHKASAPSGTVMRKGVSPGAVKDSGGIGGIGTDLIPGLDDHRKSKK